MKNWYSLHCPYCGHRVGLHAGAGSIAARPGTCSESAQEPDGSWTPCSCPGWWDDGFGTVIDRTAPSLFDEEGVS